MNMPNLTGNNDLNLQKIMSVHPVDFSGRGIPSCQEETLIVLDIGSTGDNVLLRKAPLNR